MRTLLTSGLGLAVALNLPRAAAACTVCGNHGDAFRTLLVYGAFMITPFLLAGAVGFVIRRQVRALQQSEEAVPVP